MCIRDRLKLFWLSGTFSLFVVLCASILKTMTMNPPQGEPFSETMKMNILPQGETRGSAEGTQGGGEGIEQTANSSAGSFMAAPGLSAPDLGAAATDTQATQGAVQRPTLEKLARELSMFIETAVLRYQKAIAARTNGFNPKEDIMEQMIKDWTTWDQVKTLLMMLAFAPDEKDPWFSLISSVSYTHLTLPTNYSV